MQIVKPCYVCVPSVEFDQTVVFGMERIADVREELMGLFQPHWDEVEARLYDEKLDPDYDYGIRAEDNGRMVLFTVRDGDGVMVGNALFTLGNNFRSREYFDAQETTFFLQPSYRGVAVASAWVHYIKQALKVMGVDHITMTDRGPSGGRDLSKLYGMHGFKPLATIYVTKLGD